MHGRSTSFRFDRIHHLLGGRNLQSTAFFIVSVIVVVFVLYRILFSSRVYQYELEAADNGPLDKISPYNLNHNPVELTKASKDSFEDSTVSASLRASAIKRVADEEENAFDPSDVFNDWIPPFGAQSVPDVDSTFFSEIDTVYVIPGGGSGIPLHGSSAGRNRSQLSAFEVAGYPEWTRRRTSEAFAAFSSSTPEQQQRTIFLALSAGSLNAPNVLLDDRRVMFECQHTLQHLGALGVESKRLYGDWFSWDTVTNAVALRQFLDGLLLFRGPSRPPIQVRVFISDFHHLRMRQALSWVLSLRPQPLVDGNLNMPLGSRNPSDVSSKNGRNPLRGKHVEVTIHVVDSLGLSIATDPAAWKARVQHEEAGVAQIQRHQTRITHLRQLQAFLFLGGHGGLRKYLLQKYTPSAGLGW